MQGTYQNIVLSGLQHLDGQENPGGVSEQAYIILLSELATEGAPAAGTTPEGVLTITGNHLMATGKSPIPVFTLYEKSDFESAITGELFSKMFMPTVTFFLPQATPANAGNFSVIKNARMMVLIKNPGLTGGFIQIGTKQLSAKVKDGTVKFGKGPTGEPGVTFHVEAPSIHPYYYYTGILPVTGV